MTLPKHNEIKAICDRVTRLNGHEEKYIARLYYGDTPKEIKRETTTNCDFEFKDLSYSTAYKVKVCIIPIFGVTRLFQFFSSYSVKCRNSR